MCLVYRMLPVADEYSDLAGRGGMLASELSHRGVRSSSATTPAQLYMSFE